jgi:hypothetical protein
MKVNDGLLSISILHQEFAYETGVRFEGLSISEASDGWKVVIRGRLRDGDAVYAMTVGEEPVAALQGLVEALCGREGLRFWHTDKFRK